MKISVLLGDSKMSTKELGILHRFESRLERFGPNRAHRQMRLIVRCVDLSRVNRCLMEKMLERLLCARANV